MKLIIFGLSISSSWGNGHATLWRGLCRALAARGHEVIFCERDVPYYAENRDLLELPDGELVLYDDWADIRGRVRRELALADLAIVTSYCPDGVAAGRLILDACPGVSTYYDLDTPVTLASLGAGEDLAYLDPAMVGCFDLVLSFTGGSTLDRLRQELGARRVAPLYGWVDPLVHRPTPPDPTYRGDLSHLGTFAPDRQAALEELFLRPAQACPARRFMLGGAGYPRDFPWTENLFFVRHLPPAEHGAFFNSSRLTLNITRHSMAAMGYCPSGRLFEAAACGVPVVSDAWDGLDLFFEPGSEILIARDCQDVLNALQLSDLELHQMAQAARDRTLREHTADARVRQLERIVDGLELEASHGTPGGRAAMPALHPGA